jgi:cytochrome c
MKARSVAGKLVVLGSATLFAGAVYASPVELFKKNGCAACHAPAAKMVGPSLADIANKYKGQADAQAKLEKKVKAGGSGVWGPIPMPAQAQLSDADNKAMVQWILSGAK